MGKRINKTKCTICRERFAKIYTPPRCVRCVTGRAPGRPSLSVSERSLRERGEKPRRKGKFRGQLVHMPGRGRPRLDPDLPDAEIERAFAAAKAQIRERGVTT